MVTFNKYIEDRGDMFPLGDLINYTAGSPNSINWWNTTDSEETLKANLKNPETKLTLQKSGYLDNPICYKYNSKGFRSSEFDQGKGLVTLGCSFTYGTGLHLDEVWGSKLAKRLKLPFYNLGMAGSSINTAFRFLLSNIDNIEIDTVAVLGPNMLRREQLGNVQLDPLSPKGSHQIVHLGPWEYDYFNSPSIKEQHTYINKFNETFFLFEPNSILNYYSNLNALKYLCLSKHKKFIHIYIEDIRDYFNHILHNDQDNHVTSICGARDLSHWSKEAHSFIADLFFNTLHKKRTTFNPNDYGIARV